MGRFTWAGPVVGEFSRPTHLSLHPLSLQSGRTHYWRSQVGGPTCRNPRLCPQTKMLKRPRPTEALKSFVPNDLMAIQEFVPNDSWPSQKGQRPQPPKKRLGGPTTKDAQNGTIAKPHTNSEVGTSSRASALIPQAPYLTPTHGQPSYPNPHPPAPYTLCRGGSAA